VSPLFWLSPGNPHQRTGGFLYNARMVQELGVLGVPSQVLVLEDAWPLPSAPEHAETLGQVPDGATVIADGLLWTGLEPVERARLCVRCRVWVVIHSPLDKEGSAAEGLAAREAHAVAEAYGWWATSAATGRLMAERLGEKQAVVVVPGTDAGVQGAPGDPCALLAVGHLTRRKNHRLMLEALAQCLDLEWSLRVVGATTRSPETHAELKCAVGELGLQDRVHFLGELDGAALSTVYRTSGLLLHTADYEAYGMVLTEALAHGLPVMSRPAGALEGLESPAVIRITAQAGPGEWARSLRLWLSSPTSATAAVTAARTLVFPSWRAQAMVLSEHLQT
jgi:glycosyltransferase involved in cell wall biosynthesis